MRWALDLYKLITITFWHSIQTLFGLDRYVTLGFSFIMLYIYIYIYYLLNLIINTTTSYVSFVKIVDCFSLSQHLMSFWSKFDREKVWILEIPNKVINRNQILSKREAYGCKVNNKISQTFHCITSSGA